MLVTGFGICGALPGFGAAEGSDANIAAQVEGFAVELHGGFVGLAGHGVVDVATGGIVSFGREAGADFEIANGATPETRVRVFLVDGSGGGWGDGNNAEAESARARRDADDGAVGGLPVAAEAVRFGGEGRGGGKEEGRSEGKDASWLSGR